MAWNEGLHPRGKDGKFINMNSRVKVGSKTGRVIDNRKSSDGIRLTVKFDDGTQSKAVSPHHVTVLGGAPPSQNKPVTKTWAAKTSDRVAKDIKTTVAAGGPSVASKPTPVSGLTGDHKTNVEAAMAKQHSFAPKAFSNFSGVRGLSAAESGNLKATHGHDALGGFDGTNILVGKSLLSPKSERDYQSEQKSGWLSKSDANGLQNFISHESGHYIDGVIQRSGPDTAKPVWTTIAKEFGLKPPSFMDKRSLDKWLARPENNKALSAGVSKYGASASDELFAEIWASYTASNKPSPQISAIGKIMAALAEKNAGR